MLQRVRTQSHALPCATSLLAWRMLAGECSVATCEAVRLAVMFAWSNIMSKKGFNHGPSGVILPVLQLFRQSAVV